MANNNSIPESIDANLAKRNGENTYTKGRNVFESDPLDPSFILKNKTGVVPKRLPKGSMYPLNGELFFYDGTTSQTIATKTYVDAAFGGTIDPDIIEGSNNAARSGAVYTENSTTIQSILNYCIDRNYRWRSFVNESTSGGSIPDLQNNDVFMSTVTGTVLGLSVEKGDLILRDSAWKKISVGIIDQSFSNAIANLRSIDPNYTFYGFVNTSTVTSSLPSTATDSVYLAVESGTIFGVLPVQKGDYILRTSTPSWVVLENPSNLSDVLNIQKDVDSYRKDSRILESGLSKLTPSGGWGYNGDVLEAIGLDNFSVKAYSGVETCNDNLAVVMKMKPTVVDGSGDVQFGIGRRSYTAGFAFTLSNISGVNELKTYTIDNDNFTLINTYAFPFDIVVGTEYLLKLTKNVSSVAIEVWDDSGDNYFIKNDLAYLAGATACWGRPTGYVQKGTAQLINYYAITDYNTSGRLCAWGDSFIEGNSIPNDKDKRYIALLQTLLGNDMVAIFGRGGESTTSIQGRFTGEVEWMQRCKYALIALGTNDTSLSAYQANMPLLIQKAKDYGMIPILVTITPRTDAKDNTGYIDSLNTYIRGLGELYVDMNKAVTTDGITWKVGYQLPDLVHPSIEGHNAMYNRLVFDCPFLL